MKIFVTGATGFIGRHLIKHLQDSGHSVWALVRPGSGRGLPPSVIQIPGDIGNVIPWQNKLAEVDALIHLAAKYQIGGVDRELMAACNIEGTRRVLHAAYRVGVPRIVHVSSTAALGETRAGLANETQMHNGRFRSFYEQTKHTAHGIALSLQAKGANLCIAIPGGVFGLGDRSGLAQTLGQFMQGKLPLLLDSSSQFQLCPVQALCDGLTRVLEQGHAGRNYLLTGQAVSLKQLLEALGREHHIPLPKCVSPHKLALAAKVMDALRPLGLNAPLSQEILQVMDGSSYLYSSARAQSELLWPWGQICDDFWGQFQQYAALIKANPPAPQ